MTLDSVFELIKKFADVLIVWAMFYYILKNLRKNVKMAFELGCTIYSGKPIDQNRFEQALKKLGLI